MTVFKALSVWWDEDDVGELAVDRNGETSFRYTGTWLDRRGARAISQSLPLRPEPFPQRECRPFFDGLLPEEGQREAVAAALGVSRQNYFKLLAELGGEVAGAISLWPEGEAPTSAPEGAAPFDALTPDELGRIIDRLPTRPMLAGEGELRLSLAGAQSKLPVLVRGGEIALPAPGRPSTHILKPPIARFEGTTENEAFAMRLARQASLDVAEVNIGTAGARRFLLVKRYDRLVEADGRTKRLHQEDFCQALGYLPERKYVSDGGPGFRESFALLRAAATRPAGDVLALLDAAIFNLIIGNADAHSKNFSLLYTARGTRLAPLYDLLSTVAYPDLSSALAMKISRRARLEDLKPKDWTLFSEETGVGEPYIRRRVRELCEIVLNVSGSVIDSFDGGDYTAEMTPFRDRIDQRAERLKALV